MKKLLVFLLITTSAFSMYADPTHQQNKQTIQVGYINFFESGALTDRNKQLCMNFQPNDVLNAFNQQLTSFITNGYSNFNQKYGMANAWFLWYMEYLTNQSGSHQGDSKSEAEKKVKEWIKKCKSHQRSPNAQQSFQEKINDTGKAFVVNLTEQGYSSESIQKNDSYTETTMHSQSVYQETFPYQNITSQQFSYDRFLTNEASRLLKLFSDKDQSLRWMAQNWQLMDTIRNQEQRRQFITEQKQTLLIKHPIIQQLKQENNPKCPNNIKDNQCQHKEIYLSEIQKQENKYAIEQENLKLFQQRILNLNKAIQVNWKYWFKDPRIYGETFPEFQNRFSSIFNTFGQNSIIEIPLDSSISFDPKIFEQALKNILYVHTYGHLDPNPNVKKLAQSNQFPKVYQIALKKYESILTFDVSRKMHEASLQEFYPMLDEKTQQWDAKVEQVQEKPVCLKYFCETSRENFKLDNQESINQAKTKGCQHAEGLLKTYKEIQAMLEKLKINYECNSSNTYTIIHNAQQTDPLQELHGQLKALIPIHTEKETLENRINDLKQLSEQQSAKFKQEQIEYNNTIQSLLNELKEKNII